MVIHYNGLRVENEGGAALMYYERERIRLYYDI